MTEYVGIWWACHEKELEWSLKAEMESFLGYIVCKKKKKKGPEQCIQNANFRVRKKI